MTYVYSKFFYTLHQYYIFQVCYDIFDTNLFFHPNEYTLHRLYPNHDTIQKDEDFYSTTHIYHN